MSDSLKPWIQNKATEYRRNHGCSLSYEQKGKVLQIVAFNNIRDPNDGESTSKDVWAEAHDSQLKLYIRMDAKAVNDFEKEKSQAIYSYLGGLFIISSFHFAISTTYIPGPNKPSNAGKGAVNRSSQVANRPPSLVLHVHSFQYRTAKGSSHFGVSIWIKFSLTMQEWVKEILAEMEMRKTHGSGNLPPGHWRMEGITLDDLDEAYERAKDVVAPKSGSISKKRSKDGEEEHLRKRQRLGLPEHNSSPTPSINSKAETTMIAGTGSSVAHSPPPPASVLSVGDSERDSDSVGAAEPNDSASVDDDGEDEEVAQALTSTPKPLSEYQQSLKELEEKHKRDDLRAAGHVVDTPVKSAANNLGQKRSVPGAEGHDQYGMHSTPRAVRMGESERTPRSDELLTPAHKEPLVVPEAAEKDIVTFGTSNQDGVRSVRQQAVAPNEKDISLPHADRTSEQQAVAPPHGAVGKSKRKRLSARVPLSRFELDSPGSDTAELEGEQADKQIISASSNDVVVDLTENADSQHQQGAREGGVNATVASGPEQVEEAESFPVLVVADPALHQGEQSSGGDEEVDELASQAVQSLRAGQSPKPGRTPAPIHMSADACDVEAHEKAASDHRRRRPRKSIPSNSEFWESVPQPPAVVEAEAESEDDGFEFVSFREGDVPMEQAEKEDQEHAIVVKMESQESQRKSMGLAEGLSENSALVISGKRKRPSSRQSQDTVSQVPSATELQRTLYSKSLTIQMDVTAADIITWTTFDGEDEAGSIKNDAAANAREARPETWLEREIRRFCAAGYPTDPDEAASDSGRQFRSSPLPQAAAPHVIPSQNVPSTAPAKASKTSNRDGAGRHTTGDMAAVLRSFATNLQTTSTPLMQDERARRASPGSMGKVAKDLEDQLRVYAMKLQTAGEVVAKTAVPATTNADGNLLDKMRSFAKRLQETDGTAIRAEQAAPIKEGREKASLEGKLRSFASDLQAEASSRDEPRRSQSLARTSVQPGPEPLARPLSQCRQSSAVQPLHSRTPKPSGEVGKAASNGSARGSAKPTRSTEPLRAEIHHRLVQPYGLTTSDATDLWYCCSGNLDVASTIAAHNIAVLESQAFEDSLPEEVATAYLSCWPYEDDILALARDLTRPRTLALRKLVEDRRGRGSLEARRKFLQENKVARYFERKVRYPYSAESQLV